MARAARSGPDLAEPAAGPAGLDLASRRNGGSGNDHAAPPGSDSAPAAPHALHQPLTVRTLLEQPAFRAATVIAGGDGLDRPITMCLPWTELTCHPQPLDDVAVHLRLDQVSGDGDALACREIRGAASLLVTGPTSALTKERFADIGIPVVQLPATIGFAQLARAVAEHVLDREAHVLRYTQAVHRSLAELHNRGAGLSALTHQVAKLTSAPVFVLDVSGDVVAQDQPGREMPELALRGLATLRELVGEPTRPDTPPAHDVRRTEVALGDRSLLALGSALTVAGRHYGWLVVMELAEDPDPHDTAQHAVVVHEAAALLGAELLRLRSVQEAEERARGDFVQALVHGRFTSLHDLSARAKHHDFDVNGRYGVVVVGGLGAIGTAQGYARLSVLARHVARLAPQRGVPNFATVIGDTVVVIRQVVGEAVRGDAAAAEAEVAEFAQLVCRELERRTGQRLHVTYGRTGVGPARVAESYREARIALGVCARLRIHEVSSYSTLRVFAAIAAIADAPDGAALPAEVLGPLRRADEGGGDLEATVLAYVESGGNINAAARRLQMHRNTVLYKLDRASRVLGVDIREPEQQFAIWLASRIDMLSAIQNDVDREFTP